MNLLDAKVIMIQLMFVKLDIELPKEEMLFKLRLVHILIIFTNSVLYQLFLYLVFVSSYFERSKSLCNMMHYLMEFLFLYIFGDLWSPSIFCRNVDQTLNCLTSIPNAARHFCILSVDYCICLLVLLSLKD